jgi:hypothetical protein
MELSLRCRCRRSSCSGCGARFCRHRKQVIDFYLRKALRATGQCLQHKTSQRSASIPAITTMRSKLPLQVKRGPVAANPAFVGAPRASVGQAAEQAGLQWKHPFPSQLYHSSQSTSSPAIEPQRMTKRRQQHGLNAHSAVEQSDVAWHGTLPLQFALFNYGQGFKRRHMRYRHPRPANGCGACRQGGNV